MAYFFGLGRILPLFCEAEFYFLRKVQANFHNILSKGLRNIKLNSYICGLK